MEIPLRPCRGRFMATQVVARGDEFSNLTFLDVAYSMPRFGDCRMNLSRLVAACKTAESDKCKVSPAGWCDPCCKTYRVIYTIIPDGGVKYTN